MAAPTGYDDDLCAWALHNAELLRQGRFTEMDVDKLAEELENMAKSNRRELVSRLSVLLAHLLKWRHQPARRGNSWRLTITNQRDELRDLLEESPSLRHDMGARLDRAYLRARRQASAETGLDAQAFPDSCPYTLEQILDEDFWPD